MYTWPISDEIRPKAPCYSLVMCGAPNNYTCIESSSRQELLQASGLPVDGNHQVDCACGDALSYMPRPGSDQVIID